MVENKIFGCIEMHFKSKGQAFVKSDWQHWLVENIVPSLVFWVYYCHIAASPLLSAFAWQCIIMGVKINDPANCGVCSVIRFLNARGHNGSNIHHQLCETYEPTAVREGKLS